MLSSSSLMFTVHSTHPYCPMDSPHKGPAKVSMSWHDYAIIALPDVYCPQHTSLLPHGFPSQRASKDFHVMAWLCCHCPPWCLLSTAHNTSLLPHGFPSRKASKDFRVMAWLCCHCPPWCLLSTAHNTSLLPHGFPSRKASKDFRVMAWLCCHCPPWCLLSTAHIPTLIARFMEPSWGPSGANRSQVGPVLAPWTAIWALSHGFPSRRDSKTFPCHGMIMLPLSSLTIAVHSTHPLRKLMP